MPSWPIRKFRRQRTSSGERCCSRFFRVDGERLGVYVRFVTKTTFETLTETIQAEIESYPIADIIAAYCETHAGKSVSEKDIKNLQEANPKFGFSLHKSKYAYSPETSITAGENGKWSDTRMDIRIARVSKYAKWPTVVSLKTDSNNARYFHFKDERNADREKLLNPNTGKIAGLRKVAELTDQLALLHAEIKATIEDYALDSGVEYKVTAILKEKTNNEIKFY